jgi:hypothetical protein
VWLQHERNAFAITNDVCPCSAPALVEVMRVTQKLDSVFASWEKICDHLVRTMLCKV